MFGGLPVLKDVVRLSLLERVSPEYLIRFLRPFEDYLADREVLLDDTAVNDEWLGRLHRVVNAVDATMPAKLQQAFIDVADLASDEAREQLLEIAGERQLSLFRPDDHLTPYDLAFKVYLEHGDLFAATHARVQSREARRFVEFLAKSPAVMKGHLNEAKRVLLSSRLGRWFNDRNCTGYCDVRVTERGDEVSFLIVHGSAPRNMSVIASETSRSRLSFVPDKQDTVVFDKASGRLSVHARWPTEQEIYRRVVGEVFFGDPGHFLAKEVFSGDPIVEDGAAALAVGDVPGLTAAILKKVEVHEAADPGERLQWRGPDLGKKLGSETARTFFDGRVVTYVKLGLALRSRSRLVPVEITAPNKVTYDRRVGDDVIREFLLARRFMRLPAINDAGEGTGIAE